MIGLGGLGMPAADDEHVKLVYQAAWDTSPLPSLDNVVSTLYQDSSAPIPNAFWAQISPVNTLQRSIHAKEWAARRDAILKEHQSLSGDHISAQSTLSGSQMPYKKFRPTVDPVPSYIFCHPIAESIIRDEQEMASYVPYVGEGERQIAEDSYFRKFGQWTALSKDWNPDRASEFLSAFSRDELIFAGVVSILEAKQSLESDIAIDTDSRHLDDGSTEIEIEREAKRQRIDDTRVLPLSLESIGLLKHSSDLLAATNPQPPEQPAKGKASELMWCQHPNCMAYGCVGHRER